jgi:hypothetical protein
MQLCIGWQGLIDKQIRKFLAPIKYAKASTTSKHSEKRVRFFKFRHRNLHPRPNDIGGQAEVNWGELGTLELK